MNKPLFATLLLLSLAFPATAQITPDNTLGNESSRIRRGNIRGVNSTIIDKGARRGANLFHSFTEFNIPEGGGAYFTNPTGIENILSRVTGKSPSNLLGVLGVLGNANLFFINPNGIIFGPNAKLDIKGAFTASTADSILFENNFQFSASDPQSPPLLTINIPIGLGLRENSKDIGSSGNLTTENNLTLSANNLDLSGSIVSGGNLTLEAQNLLTIKDSPLTPSTELSQTASVPVAEGNLLIPRNQGINISTLNHSDSLIAAGKSLILRAANPVNGNAYFWSGGDFRVENLEGNLGSLRSPSAPIINALGDVSLNDYQGQSLQIIAGGKITIPDSIWITGVNPNYGSPETITLSNGQQVTLNGKTENIVDLRAGVSPNIIKNLGIQRNLTLPTTDSTETPTSADITVGTTIFRSADLSQQLGGKVLLTNQYQPNPNLKGNITVTDNYPDAGFGAIETSSPNSGGTIALDSQNNLTAVGNLLAYSTPQMGKIILNSGGNMSLQGFTVNSLDPNENTIRDSININSQGNLAIAGGLGSFGGDIVVNGGGNIDFQGNLLTGSPSFTQDGGAIRVSSQGEMRLTGIVSTKSTRQGGDITLKSNGDIVLEGASLTTEAAPGGKIEIRAENLILKAQDESDIENSRSTISAGIGTGLKAPSQKAGDVDIKVNNLFQMSQAALISNWLWNETQGDGGNINIEAKSIEVKDGSQISTINQGTGKIGDILLKADRVKVDGGINVVVDGTPTNLTSRVYSNAYETEQGDSGNLTINTKTLEITNGADIGVENFVNGKGNGGNVVIHAIESVLVDGEGSGEFNGKPIVFGSQIASNLGLDAIGKAGNIDITTDSLKVTNGSKISGAVFGTGDGGKITINAKSVLVKGEKSDGFPSLIDSSLQLGQGKSGDIEINADSLAIKGGAQVNASSFAQGDGGTIKLNVRDFVLAGETGRGQPSILGTGVSDGGKGDAGTIDIKAGTVNILQGGQIQSLVEGLGNAGEINIQADKVKLSGTTSIDAGAGISSQIGPEAKGDAGTVRIKADSLVIEKDAGIDSATFGLGNAGSILIDVDRINLSDADINSTIEPGGRGNGGEIVIDSKTINSNFSFISVAVGKDAIGDSGNITINTDSLKLLRGSQIQGSIFKRAQGDGGNITVNAPQIIIDGEQSNTNAVSLISTAVETMAAGDAGNIEISTEHLNLSRGGQIQAAMLGQGKAGSIKINASEINVSGEASDGIGSGIVSSLAKEGIGRGGEVTLLTDQLNLTDGGFISATTRGIGDSGKISIEAQEILIDGRTIDRKDASGINTGVGPEGKGRAGDISLTTDSLKIKNGGEIRSNTVAQGDAGLIGIETTEKTELQGNRSSISSRVFKNAVGDGGRIEINTSVLSIADGARITASTAGKGSSGNVVLDVDQLLNLDGGSISTAVETTGIADRPSSIEINTPFLQLGEKSEITASTSGLGDAGTIEINTSQITLGQKATISAFTQGDGDGGNIEIDASKAVNLGTNSNLTVETSSSGKAGNITISSDTISLGENAQLSATATRDSTNTEGGGSISLNVSNLFISGKLGIFAETQGEAPAGNLILKPFNNQPNFNLTFSDNGFISARTTAQGRGGNIDISASNNIDLRGQGKITTETSGTGNAGNVNILGKKLTLANGVEISASTTGEGNAGQVNFTGDRLKLTGESEIQTSTNSSGKAGDINLTITDTLKLNNSSILATTSRESTGDGGNIAIDPNIVNLRNNSQIAVNSQGQGDGGSISLIAGDLNLKDNSTISAATASGEGGNITLNVNNLTILDTNSPIVAEAGGTGNGGNIILNTQFLIAGGNSDINANAFEGTGGNINITAQGIFLDRNSEITASSQFGLDGVVETNTPAIDPTKGILNFSSEVTDAADLIANNFCEKSKESKFIVTGKGGIPITPYQELEDNGVQVDLLRPVLSPQPPRKSEKEKTNPQSTSIPRSRNMVPARGWIFNEQGQAVLVGYDPTGTPVLSSRDSEKSQYVCQPE